MKRAALAHDSNHTLFCAFQVLSTGPRQALALPHSHDARPSLRGLLPIHRSSAPSMPSQSEHHSSSPEAAKDPPASAPADDRTGGATGASSTGDCAPCQIQKPSEEGEGMASTEPAAVQAERAPVGTTSSPARRGRGRPPLSQFCQVCNVEVSHLGGFFKVRTGRRTASGGGRQQRACLSALCLQRPTLRLRHPAVAPLSDAQSGLYKALNHSPDRHA